ncbi:MAG: transglycosylase SLT domain-containing protein [Myxococcota bacterium]
MGNNSILRGHIWTMALAVLWLGVGESAATVPASARSVPVLPHGREQAAISAAGVLRAANERFAANDREGAERLLEQIASHPVIADYALLLLMRSLVESGRTAEAIVMHLQWERLDSPLDAEFFTLLGRAYASEGAEGQARGAWSRALESETRSDRLAALHTSIGASNERTERFEQAAQAYLEVWIHHPETDSAAAADSALERLEARFGRTLRTTVEYRKRGDALFRLRHNEAALETYDRAIAAKPSRIERRRAERKRAQTLFRLRRYPEAARAYGRLPADDETAIEIARAHARSGDVPKAIRELEAIGERTRSQHSLRANYLAGLLTEEDDPERARSFFENTVARGGATSYAKAAIWRLGWSSFRAGEYAEAIDYFDRLIRSDEALSGLRPRYWRARALEHSGASGAAGVYALLAREFPFSYYGWRASQRSRKPANGGSEVGFDPGIAAPLDSGTPALGSVALARPAILIEAGMIEAANAELVRLFAAASGLSDRLALAQLYSETGDFHRAQRVVVDAYSDRLASTPALADLDIWWHAWPAPFADAIRKTAERGVRVEPGLVYAVMREESGYRPKVLSVSGARGLLQIMPETGARLALSESLPEFSSDDLFDPETNIHLGSAYLEQLLAKFDGRAAAAVAGYNAGPKAVLRWLESGPSEDDEWVEAIPYDQTRTYVKRVLRSLHVYRVLY